MTGRDNIGSNLTRIWPAGRRCARLSGRV